MGYGDDLIVTSIVKRAKLKHPSRPICVGDGHNILWSEVFDNNPKISKTIEPNALWVRDVAGNRPYIDYSKSTPDRLSWKKFPLEVGEIFFKDEELRHTQSDFVYIEPNVKGTFSSNKDWGFDNWQSVVDLLPDVRFIQGIGRRLKNVEQVETRSFRDACALLSRAFLFVGTDGGLHHAAAALGIPAVLVWSPFVPPDLLGYEFHVKLCGSNKYCGNVKECSHCREAMNSIKPEKVAEEIERFRRSRKTLSPVRSAA